MSFPANYVPREGDVVVLHGTVKYDLEAGDEKVFVRPEGHYQDIRFSLEELHGVVSRAWHAGDQVETPRGFVGEVVATHGDKVWVNLGRGFDTYECLELKIAPAAVEDLPRASDVEGGDKETVL